MSQIGESEVTTVWKTSIERHFGDMPDPRSGPAKLHRLIDIFTIALLGVICGADDWEAVADFGERREGWLKGFLALPNGIPSHDTFNRVFSLIEPKAFQTRYLNWVKTLMPALAEGTDANKHLALDGKALRGSADAFQGQDAIKMISAYAVDSGLVLAQQAVPDDTNEIGAMPELLKILGLQGSIVTVDAANCQIENAKIILKQGGDYVFALKGNQGTLHDQVREMFEGQAELKAGAQASVSTVETHEQGHGRSEWRHYTVLYDKDFLNYLNHNDRGWQIKSVIRVERKRQIADRLEHKVHYYISSLPGQQANLIANCIRTHWGIENGAHWILDVTFHEDYSRVRTGFGPENLATLRHMALNFLKSEKSVKKSINRKRFTAALDPNYLLKILRAGIRTDSNLVVQP